MDEQITQLVNEIANDYGVEVVNARQRGSRRINAEHENSDYDVQFLFKKPLTDYANIYDTIDSIHEPNDPIDAHGWDIQKFGHLLVESNPNAIEYCRSPTEYISSSADFTPVEEQAMNNANLMDLYYHYISMAKSNYQKYVHGENKSPVNRQFHVARSIAAAQHIRKSDDLPLVDIRELIQSEYLREGLADTLEELLMYRVDGNGEMEIVDFVGDYYSMESDAVIEPTVARTRQPEFEVINSFIESEFQ